ncbi:SipW-dependent-type signal peptide-containing protein [Dietzia sp. 179-F 9C3 NHS]|uniref:SipW-dependent-type signal peptide-containing protein n=1 Tax=Dietzia sp. 179-F 9C3 NHS TaxID=3374295 RepID=UPI00387A4C36
MSVLKSRKSRALLAGGVVLGIGASMTLAAWSDSEWASGSFSTGGFTFQGSLDGQNFAEHATEDKAASMTFVTNPEALKPGDSVTASYWVQTNGPVATVKLQQPKIENSNALVDALQVEVFKGDCTSGTSAKSGPLKSIGEIDLGDVGGTAVQTCFKVTLPNTYNVADELSTGAVAWEFQAKTA